jgi:DNA-binding HxlR family transcriptional regulator
MVGPAAITENMLKRRWSASILRYLDKGVTDPAEISKHEVNLSPAVMSERLRAMLRYSLIARYPRPAPSKVIEFRLTPRGRKILKMLDIIDRLDEPDQCLTPNGHEVEESLGRATASASDCLTKSEPSVSDKQPRSKKSTNTASPLPTPIPSLP